MGDGVWFTVLGPVRAWRGEVELGLGAPQQRALLAVLLLREGSQASMGELAEALWGDAEPEAATAVIRTYVSRLRRELDESGAGAGARDSLIATIGGGYALAAVPGGFDLAVFRREVAVAESARRGGEPARAAGHLRGALALWRGKALAGIPGEYAAAERARLELLRLGALTLRLELDVDLGGHAAVVPELTHLAGQHPLDERLRELLMLALYRSGHQARALASYRDVQVQLASELGVDPGPALQDLYQRILRADPALLAAPAESPDRQATQSPHTASPGVPAADGEASIPRPRLASGGNIADGTGPTEDTKNSGGSDEADGARLAADSAGAGSPVVESGSAAATASGGDPAHPAYRRPQRPNLLPPRLAVFTGREGELRAAHELLADPDSGSRPGAVVVTGMAGVGKTAFAVHWAHQLADRFPDGQFYLNLRGFDPGREPVAADAAVRAVLEFLDVPADSVPEDPEAAAALCLGLLAGRRVLLLLDNARVAAQVRPLLPGESGSLAIVTSRNRLMGLQALDGAQAVALGVPTPAEARDLLVRRIGARRTEREPEAVREIVERCGRLPLALAVVAAQCAVRPDFPLQAVTTALRLDSGDGSARLDALGPSEPDEHADARRVFSWSYRALSGPAARLFRFAALHPGPDAGAPALASLVGLPPRATAKLLAELTGAHLLAEPAVGRYEYHDLLRAYAGELGQELDPAAEQDAARRRMADYYVRGAVAALREYSPYEMAWNPALPSPEAVIDEPADRAAATRWFETEHAPVMAVAEQALEHGLDDHVWDLAWAMHPYLYRASRTRDAVTLHGLALKAAQRHGALDRVARAHNQLGTAYLERGRTDEALRHQTAALAAAETLCDPMCLAACHLGLARVAGADGRSRDCIGHNERAMRLARESGNQMQLAVALVNLADQYGRIGEYRKSLDLCTEALVLWTEMGEPYAEAAIHESLGWATFQLGRRERALEHFRLAAGLYEDLGDGFNQAKTLVRCGDAHASAHDAESAAVAWSAALDILRALDHPDAATVSAKLDGVKLPG